MRILKQLPLPSKLLSEALDALNECEKDPKYSISMREWHKPSKSKGTCRVCLAGAWLAKVMNLPRTQDLECHCLPKLMDSATDALEALRNGQISDAFLSLGLNALNFKIPGSISVPLYAEKRQFKIVLRRLVRRLRKAGA